MPGRVRNLVTGAALTCASVLLASAVILGFDAAVRETSRQNPKYSEWFFVRDVNHFLVPSDPGYPTNSDGIRSRREPHEFPDGGRNVVFLGDSFVFGYNVRVHEALPARVEALMRERPGAEDIRVANFGWTSASPFVENRLFGRIGHRYHPQLVVLGLDMTDFHDDIKYELMHWRQGIYRVYDLFPLTLSVFRERAPELFWRVHSWSLDGRLPRQKFFACEQPLARSAALLETTIRNLQTIHRSVTLRGAKFVVVVLPRGFQHNPAESPDNWEKDLYTPMGPYSREPFRFMDQAASRLPFPVYSLLPVFEAATEFPLYARNDPHWNHAGTAVAARAVTDIVAFETGWGDEAGGRDALAARVAPLRLGAGGR